MQRGVFGQLNASCEYPFAVISSVLDVGQILPQIPVVLLMSPIHLYNILMKKDTQKLSPVFKLFNQQKNLTDNTPSKTNKKSSSLSTDNSPRGQQILSFKIDIPFPTLRPRKDRRKQSNPSFKQVATVVTEQYQQNQLKHYLKHPKLMSDQDQFNKRSSSISKSAFRGKSLGVLGRVEEDKEEETEVKTRKRKTSRIGSFIDKNQFNKQQTGIVQKEESFDTPVAQNSNIINSITQIEESKEGTILTMPAKSSDLNLIVDEVDKPQKPRQQFKNQVQCIQEQKIEQQKQQPLLRAQLQKLQQEKDLMKKIITYDTIGNDSAKLETENVSMLTTESIKQEQEQHIEDQK